MDIIGPWGDASNLGNPYAYVGNNPWSNLDPWGLGQYGPYGVLFSGGRPPVINALAESFGQIVEFLIGGRRHVAENTFDLPKGGPGGVVGGATSAATLRLSPIEENPSAFSQTGMEAGAAQVPFLDSAERLATGETVSGLSANRVVAGAELAIQVIPFAVAARAQMATGAVKASKTSASAGRIGGETATAGPRRMTLPAYANSFDNVSDAARIAAKKYPAITPPTNRRGLRTALGEPPEGMTNPQAQHDLPWTLKDWFAGEGRGLNVNDKAYGRWVEGTPPGTHQRWSGEFESEWRKFIRDNPTANRDQVITKMHQLRGDPRFR